MSVFTRPDSPWWWLWLETAQPGQRREKTAVKVGTTVTERKDSRRLAELVYAQRMHEIAARIHRLPIERPTIRFEAYAVIYQRDVSSHTKSAEREAELLKTLKAGFGPELLHAIDRDRVRQWMTVRRQAVSASTVNREVDLLKAMLREATPKYLEASPLVGMKRLKVIRPKRRLLTPEEERRLLRVLKKDDRAIVLMGLDTLCRLGDILDLRREDDHGQTLFIRDPKDPNQNEPYEVPVSTRLRRALDAVPGDKPYYFHRRRVAKTDRDKRNAIGHFLKRACVKVGIPYGRKVGGITFHWATRRTGATRMLQRGVDLKTVQAIGHWKTADVVLDIYAETTSKAARAAVELVAGPKRSRPRRKSA
jgi:integrase